MTDITNEPLSRPVLGESPYIGQLYNARSDMYLSYSIFNENIDSKVALNDHAISQTKIEYHWDQSSQDKFKHLSIDGHLSLSLLCGITTIQGELAGAYLNDTNSETKVTRMSLLYDLVTVQQTLNLSHEEVKERLSFDALNVEAATHFVESITYGAKVVANFEKEFHSEDAAMEASGKLMALLDKAKGLLQVSAGANVDFTKQENDFADSFKLSLVGDCIPTGELPHSVKDVFELLRRIPEEAQKVNDGRGKPIKVQLGPLPTLRAFFGRESIAASLVHQLSADALKQVTTALHRFHDVENRLGAVIDLTKKYKHQLEQDTVRKARDFGDEVRSTGLQYNERIKAAVLAIRHGQNPDPSLATILQEFAEGPHSTSAVETFLQNSRPFHQRLKFFDFLKCKGVIVLDMERSWNDVQLEHRPPTAFKLIYRESVRALQGADWTRNFNIFIDEVEQAQALDLSAEQILFIAEDLDVTQPMTTGNLNTESSTRIEMFQSQWRSASKDYAKDVASHMDCNVIKIDGHAVQTEPEATMAAAIKCPGASPTGCTSRPVKWTCHKCKKEMLWGYENRLHCGCGTYDITKANLQFRCQDPKHIGYYCTHDDEGQLMACLPPNAKMDRYNIVFLGETGVGKSTFINSFANYMCRDTFDDALEENLVVVIKSEFDLVFAEVDRHVSVDATIGAEQNDHLSASRSSPHLFETEDYTIPGASVTQRCRTYIITCAEKEYRLIDTPGIGDTRGLDQDQLNLQHIVSYLGHFERIHGICILLKPNEARETVLYKYCLVGLLSQLHRNAVNNIAFCYTSTRSTFWEPGNTHRMLKHQLEKLHHDHNIKVPYSRNNYFCFDNEAFRYLAAVKCEDPVTFNEKVEQDCRTSFNNAQSEAKRLLTFVHVSHPHDVQDTVSLNHARRLITDLARPVAEITQSIQNNIDLQNKALDRMKKATDDTEMLNLMLHIDYEDLELVPLDHPRTVCTASAHMTIVNGKPHYSTWCHEQCHLDNTGDVIGHPALVDCAAMDRSGICKCGCSFRLHMHITYNAERVTRKKIDEGVQLSIKNNESRKEREQRAIDAKTAEIKKHEEEQEQIRGVCAKLAVFARANAIGGFNDAIIDYLKTMIRNSDEQDGEQVKLKLTEQLKVYEAEKQAYEDAIKRADTNSDLILRADQIPGLIYELTKLPIWGKSLQDQIDIIQRSTAEHVSRNVKVNVAEHRRSNGKHIRSKQSKADGRTDGSGTEVGTNNDLALSPKDEVHQNANETSGWRSWTPKKLRPFMNIKFLWSTGAEKPTSDLSDLTHDASHSQV